jgi:hypothetical protein
MKNALYIMDIKVNLSQSFIGCVKIFCFRKVIRTAHISTQKQHNSYVSGIINISCELYDLLDRFSS